MEVVVSSPDTQEKGVRFGCGFVLGLLLGGLGGARMFFDDGSAILAVTIVVAMVPGLSAMRFGDSFWHALKHFLWKQDCQNQTHVSLSIL